MEITELYTIYEKIKDRIGAETMLEEIIQEMDSDQLQEMLEGVSKAYDLDLF